MQKIPEEQARFRGPRRVVELGWAPTVTALYVVWRLMAAGPIDYGLLVALVVLSVTSILYARKLHQKETAPIEALGEPARIEPAQFKPPVARSETPAPGEPRRVEPVVAPNELVRAERQQDQGARVAVAEKTADSKALEKQLESLKAELERSKQGAAALQSAVAEKTAASGALEKQLEVLKAELERSKQSAAALQSVVGEEPKHSAERLEVVSAITPLKERARALRRQWPDAAFCQRPLREQWWTPGSSQAASTPWLSQASEWHAQFKAARSRFFPGAADLYLRSLDLEEVIDLLDDVILSRETNPLHRDTQVTAARAPVLVITAWGAPEGEDEKCGFWIRNIAEFPATNIQLTRAAVGSKWLSIFLPPSSVLAKDQKVFAIASLTGAQRATAYHLEDQFRKLPANSLNAANPLGVGLRLIYDSKDGNRYASRHEMTLEDGVLKVGYVNTEILAMPV